MSFRDWAEPRAPLIGTLIILLLAVAVLIVISVLRGH
jgi:hypothetical protein